MARKSTSQALDLLTDEEVQAIVMALLTTRGKQGATVDDMHIAVNWANEAKAMAALLKLVLKKQVSLNVKDGQVCWGYLDPVSQLVSSRSPNTPAV